MIEFSKVPCGKLFARGLFLLAALAIGLSAATSAANASGTGFVPQAKWTETLLYNFNDGDGGSDPLSGVIMDGAGNLYGTTWGGYGTIGGGGYCNCGTVFKLAPDGILTVLHAFQGASDGSFPEGSLIADSQGNLYGTTQSGGSSASGTVFEVTLNGTETVLYNFRGGSDGAVPEAGLIMDQAGNLYGTTLYGGGNNAACGSGVGAGTAFELKPNGDESVLHAFGGGSDGACPFSALIRDGSGNLYGNTGYGGNHTNCGNLGCGTVFKIAPDGSESVLYAFQDGTDGANPLGSLVLDNAGNLYGTTYEGMNSGGVAFRLAPDGKETVLHTFRGGKDGSDPAVGMIMDTSGNLFGTTDGGGCTGSGRACCASDGGCGTVFELSKGREKVLYAFRRTGGDRPGALLLGPQGQLYGTTQLGGTKRGNGYGVVFELQP